MISNTSTSLEKRARVVIIELLSESEMDRSEIRREIYKNNLLFRLNKFTYINALDSLISEGRIAIDNGKYRLIPDWERRKAGE
jgi:hypothetical protein